MLKINNLNGFSGRVPVENFYTQAPVTSGLKLYLDASLPESYTPNSEVWYGAGEDGITPIIMEGTSYSSASGGGVLFGSTSQGIGFLPEASLPYNSNGFTLSVWIRFTGTVSNARIQRNVSFNTLTSEGPVVRHNNTSNAAYNGYLFDNTATFRNIDVTNQAFTNTYYNFMLRYNGTTMNLYRNNTSVGSLSAAFTLAPLSGRVRLADKGTEWFEGELFVVHYFNRALDTTERTTLYDGYKTRFGL